MKAYLREGNHLRAAKLAEEILLEQGSNLRLHLFLGWLYETVGRPDLARDRYSRARRLAETVADNDRVRWGLLRSALRFGEGRGIKEQVESYQKITQVAVDKKVKGANERLAVALGWRGLFALAEKQPQKAAGLFRQALRRDAANLSLRFNLAVAEFFSPVKAGRSGRTGRTFVAVRTAIGSGLSGPVGLAANTLIQRLDILRLRALSEGGNPDLALSTAETLYRQRPRDSRLSQFLAETYASVNIWEKAAKHYRVVMEQAPSVALRRAGAEGLGRMQARMEEAMAHQLPPEEVALSEAAMVIDQPSYREAARILRRARRRIDAGRLREALQLLHQGWETWPEVVQFPLDRARVLTTLGRYREAQGELGRALDADPDRGETHALLAQVILARGPAGAGPGEALRHADLAKTKEESALALHARGWALSALGDVRDGAEELRRALALDPKNPEIHYRLGLSLMALDLEASALPLFEEAERLSPGHPRARLMAGLSLARLGRREEALLVLSEVAQQGRRSERRIARNTLARLTGQARRDHPSERPDVAVPPPGLPHPNASLAATSSELAEVRSPAHSRYMAAAAEVVRGNLDHAKEELRKLEAEFQGFAEPSVALAILSILDGDLEEARTSLNMVLDLRPDDPRGLLIWAAQAMASADAGSLARALGAYARTPGELPRDAFLEAVTKRWDAVLEVDPFRSKAHWHRGMLRLFAGRLVAADKDLEGAGRDLPALRGRALVALIRFAKGRDGKDFKAARDFLRQAGDRKLVRSLERIRREILKKDEVEARPVALERTWDRATATEYMTVSPQVKAMVLGVPVNHINASRARLGRNQWSFIDGILRGKKNLAIGPPEDPPKKAGPLDYDVLTGKKNAGSAFPPPGLRSDEGFDLPGEPVFEEGLFGELGDLPDLPPTSELPGLNEIAPEDEELPDMDLEVDLGEVGAVQGEIEDPDDFDELGDLGDIDLMVGPKASRSLGPVAPAPLLTPVSVETPVLAPVPSSAHSPVPLLQASVPRHSPTPPPIREATPAAGEAYLKEALAPMAQGRTDLAEERLRKVRQRFPDWEAPTRDLALLLLDTERSGAALEVIRDSSKRFGRSPFWLRLAGFLAYRRGEMDRVARLRREARKLPRRLTASAYVATAQRAWKRAGERGGGHAYAAYRLALLDFYAFQERAARDHLKEAAGVEEAEALSRQLALGAEEYPGPRGG
jgi:tetratricopeptide (TPR) repeat protein